MNLSPKGYRTNRWRLYAVLVVCSVLPLVLFLYSADRFLRTTTTKNLLQQTGLASDLAANAIEQRMTQARASLESLAADPAVLEASTRHDMPRLTADLRMAREMRPQAAFAIYNANGNLLESNPVVAAVPHTVLVPPEWFNAELQANQSYVSGAYHTGTQNVPVVTVATKINPHQPTGVLAATYTLDTIKSWTSDISTSAMKWISVVDQNGTVLTGANLDGDLSSHPEVKQVLDGKNGTEFLQLNGRRVLVTRHPLSSLGWGILVEIPAAEIDKAIWQFERPVGLIALLFVGLALGLGIVFASLYRRMRESEEHTRQVITTATDAFITIDSRGIVTDWNPKAEELFGWTKSEIIGQPLHATVMPLQYREPYLHGLERFRSTKELPAIDHRVELSALHRDGHEFSVELSITWIQRGGKNYFNAFLHDIGNRKRAEEKISKLNTELNARVSDLEERNKALEAFSYSVSHDVRAPSRNIAGFSEILEEEFKGKLSAGALDHLGRIQKNVVRLQRLVDDLLRFAHLGEHALKIQTTDLNEVVREVIATFERELAGRKVTFDVSPLPTLDCDPSLVTQVFWNLLANAVKFTGSRSQAIISIGETTQNGEKVIFVRDNGVGFDMKHAGKLFGPFQRLHRNDEFEGTGVGLATVHRIILQHQGRIWAQAEPDKGATFFFSLEPQKAAKRNSALANVG